MVQATFTPGALAYLNTLDVSFLRGIPGICGFRPSIESGVPFSTAAQTAKTQGYATPDPESPWCGVVNLYESGAWVPRKSAEISSGGSFSGFTANLPYDQFLYWNGSAIVQDLVAWTSATARATALTTQDGVYVKSGATSRLYTGTFLMTGTTGQCEWSFNTRPSFLGIWSQYNPRVVQARVTDTASTGTYASATWQAANGSANNRITAIVGLATRFACTRYINVASPPSTATGSAAIGFDSTTSPSSNIGYVYNAPGSSISEFNHVPAIGSHYWQAIEARLVGSGTVTYQYGGNSSGGGLLLGTFIQ